eukprot:2659791-Pleurochrysis_carterae.AAC.2
MTATKQPAHGQLICQPILSCDSLHSKNPMGNSVWFSTHALKVHFSGCSSPFHSLGTAPAHIGEPDYVQSLHTPNAYQACSSFFDGKLCANSVLYPALHFYKACISRNTAVRWQHVQNVAVSAEMWRAQQDWK